MIKNYFKIAWRNLLRYRFVSLINLFGLSIGITCCLLIGVYISDELSYDRYNSHADEVYRVERTFLNPDSKSISLELGAIAPPVGPLLQNDFKEIKSFTRILSIGNASMQYKEKNFNEPDIYFADENLFRIFDIDLVKGNPSNALADPYSVMLSEATARKYFGEEDPMNKVVKTSQGVTYKVTGIFRELPSNAHWHPNLLLSFSTLNDEAVYGAEQLRTNWGNNAFYTYLLLPKNYDAGHLETQFPAFLNRHIPNADNRAQEWTSLSMRKLTDIHLYSHKDSELEENGDISRVYIFGLIGLFILLIAGINYMNLSTARAALRAKEIGIRKVIGAEKKELVWQFLSESVLLCLLACLLSLVLTWLALPGLNMLSGKQLTPGQFVNAGAVLVICLLPFVVGGLSGIYPALFLAGFKPVSVLKGVIKTGHKTISLRKVLVVFQFSVSIILIIGTLIVFRQLQYIQHKSLGFDKDRLLVLNNDDALKNSFQSMKTMLLSNPSITEVGRSSRIPSGRLLDAQGSQVSKGNNMVPAKADIKDVRADEGFIPAYGIRLKAGRNFEGSDGSDTSSFILNEAAVKALGLKSDADAIGLPFQYGDRKGQIAGVMNDFNFESLHQRIIPLVLYNTTKKNGYGKITVKIKGDARQAIRHVQRTWETFVPQTPFEYTFLDNRFADLYKAEKQQQVIFTLFSCIAIFIAGLGLFGLSAFTISQRVKEIGIRKVLGATSSSIVRLVSADFLLLVVFAAVIAFPVSWFAMSKWLDDFAYRIQPEWWVFVLSGCVALFIAFCTISVQALKAANANPVDSLRDE